jgi:hypothetical protein
VDELLEEVIVRGVRVLGGLRVVPAPRRLGPDPRLRIVLVVRPVVLKRQGVRFICVSRFVARIHRRVVDERTDHLVTNLRVELRAQDQLVPRTIHPDAWTSLALVSSMHSHEADDAQIAPQLHPNLFLLFGRQLIAVDLRERAFRQTNIKPLRLNLGQNRRFHLYLLGW